MATLGIHTDVPDDKNPLKSHSWITFEKDGVTQDFSLYPQSNKYANKHGQEYGYHGSENHINHVHEGVDSKIGREPTASLYQELTPEQEAAFLEQMEKPQEYSTRNHNCAHWASQTWEKTTGQHLDIESTRDSMMETGRTETFKSPVGLEQSIIEQNQEKALETDTQKTPANEPAAALESSSQPAKKLTFAEDRQPSPERESPGREGDQGSAGKRLVFFEDKIKDNDHDLGR